MTDYYTKDGVKIEVGGVYLDFEGDRFTCLHISNLGESPIIGYFTKGGYDFAAAWGANRLTSLPEQKPVYDPADMWVLYRDDFGEIYEKYRSFNKEKLQALGGFAIAKVGQNFQRGDGL